MSFHPSKSPLISAGLPRAAVELAEKPCSPVFRRVAGASEASIMVVVLPGALMTAVAGVVDTMSAANEALGQLAYDCRLLVANASGIRLSGGLSLSGEAFDLQAAPPQNAILIGGQAPLGQQPSGQDLALRSTLSRWSRHGTRIIAVGDSIITAFAAIGAPAAASVFWSRRALIEELHPELKIRETLYTVDQRITTCAGRAGAFDLILSDIHAVHGRAKAARVADALLLGHYREGAGAQRSVQVDARTIGNVSVRSVVELMERNLEAPLKMTEICKRVNISQRQIERLFQIEYGTSPWKYYLRCRLERAHDLLMFTRLPLYEISLASGFSSPAQFNRRYRAEKGMSPSKMRSALTSFGGSVAQIV